MVYHTIWTTLLVQMSIERIQINNKYYVIRGIPTSI